MNYKIVKNAANELIAYGLDDGNYEPTIGAGEVLSIETESEAQKLIKGLEHKLISEAKAAATQKAALLARLGITADEAKLLIS